MFELLIPWTYASEMTDLVGDTASGAITNAGDIMSSPMWGVIYFIIGIALVSLVVGVVICFTRKRA